MPDKKIAVVGVGNVLMGDDGVGPAAIEELKKAGAEDKADLINAGKAFHAVVFDLEKYEKVIIIDAVKGKGSPGTLYHFDLAELRDKDRIDSAGVSVHELSVLKTLLFQEMYQDKFKNVVFIGIQPAKVTWTEGLSDTLKKAMPTLVQTVLKEICR
ncbi:MAG: hydrogenase maturation protease [Planctomycetes bacterium]|nr:hydrogenase maturation protease [Planctomycetota bacterium]